MLPEYFVVVGCITASMGFLYYLYETIVGKSKPNRVTWLLWGLFPMIVFVAQRSQGVGLISWASFAAGFVPLLIFIASLKSKKAYWQTDKEDIVLLLFALTGIVLWWLVDNANFAIMFALIADILAAVPTVKKSWQHPESESWIAYGITSLGFLVIVLSVEEFSIKSAIFVTYLLFLYMLLAILSARKPSKDPLHIEL